MDASHVYVRALALGCLSTQTPSTGLRHPSFWRKVPESGARSVCVCVCVEGGGGGHANACHVTFLLTAAFQVNTGLTLICSQSSSSK